MNNIQSNNVILYNNDLYMVTKVYQNSNKLNIRKLLQIETVQIKYQKDSHEEGLIEWYLTPLYPEKTYKIYSNKIDKETKSITIKNTDIVEVIVDIFENNKPYYKPWESDLGIVHVRDNKVYYDYFAECYLNLFEWTLIKVNCPQIIKYHKLYRENQIIKLLNRSHTANYNLLSPSQKEIFLKLKDEVINRVIHLKLVEKECPICLENNSNVYSGYYKCDHAVCDECHRNCKTDTCSLCRST